ncbi:methylmalonyl-CoA mutase metallochaperone MeaB [Flavobacterium glycines]|uniref:ATPase/protein kinase n=1 Tax=Flavobacterium glycines TaxID=551990 RepID=A0A1B9DWM6_9FLAO|nr:methylmalonyl Co-A mutase-associated GTPase MeaB [Flavobacterium glycines]OCB74090.1 ATPase/protein kinase [Flavobacterium glycines]GEL09505.1 ATPase/protein kinase [Flavobacterium glycines]SDJ04355.1 methylmalonyl-CoA mutase metallochaperone MeaB [Flavobacterium glycines]
MKKDKSEKVNNTENFSPEVFKKIQQARKLQPRTEELISSILSGDVGALSRAITLIESNNPNHFANAKALINVCLSHTKQSIRIGITGVPGVGKSTFIEAFGKHLTRQGKKVAVLTIDPSSSISHGSILGDKTRMEELAKDSNAYVRPSASGETLGGVARKTRETITLCEAAGFDIIIIETVGVGQSEIAVHSMVDFFLLLQIAGAGDELQGIKRGIMEMADAVVINKADGDNVAKAIVAKTELSRALHLFPPKKSEWTPTVSTCSAKTQEGITEIEQIIVNYIETTKNNGYFDRKRAEQNEYWLLETINNQLKEDFFNHPEIRDLLEKTKKAVQNNESSPFAAAQLLLETYFKNKP